MLLDKLVAESLEAEKEKERVATLAKQAETVANITTVIMTSARDIDLNIDVAASIAKAVSKAFVTKTD